MNLPTGAELLDSRPGTPQQPDLGIDVATAILIETGRAHLRAEDGLQECVGSLDGIGRAAMRVQLGNGAKSLTEAYDGELSLSILADLHEAAVFKCQG